MNFSILQHTFFGLSHYFGIASYEEQRNTGKLFIMYCTAIQNFCLSGNSVDHEVLKKREEHF